MRFAFALLLLTAPLLAGDPEREALPILRPPPGRLAHVTDLNGGVHRVPGDSIIAMTSTSCPLSRKFAPVLARLSQKHRIYFIDVDGADTKEAFRAFAEVHGFRGVLVHDPRRIVARALGATSTTEVFLFRNHQWVYRGAVSDQYGIGIAREKPTRDYLADALARKAAYVRCTSAPGCVLDDRPPERTNDLWHGSIQKIVNDRCVRCHRDDGAAPFALESYEQVAARADMITHVIQKGIMPPWFAAKGHLPLNNDPSLTKKECARLLKWLNSSRPKGNPDDAPLAPTWPKGWTIGKPDKIFQLPHAVPNKAQGNMEYVHLETPTGFTEDTWVRGWEVRPTANDVVHHVLIFALHPSVKRAPGGERGEFLAAFVPGNGSAIYPDGLAKRVPKGARLHFQLHYTPNGRATHDRTRVGLLLTTKPRHEIITTGISNTDLRIPAGKADHIERAAYPVRRELKLLGFIPHMHFRGSAFLYEWFAPDNKRTTLLSVPRYDFNWQLAYNLTTPFTIPAGSLLRVTATFDNSDANPLNPDSTRVVHWGDQSDDEMLIGYAEYYMPSVPAGDPVWRLSETPASEAMVHLDRNGDGVITLKECPQRYRPSFVQLDADNDGKVTWSELQPVNR